MAGLQTEGKRKSIQSRLILLLLLVLIPVLATQGYLYYQSYQNLREAELGANLELARSVAKAFEGFLQDVLQQELVIGLAVTSSHEMNAGHINRLFEASHGYLAVRDFTWMNPKGDAVYSGNSSVVGRNYSDRSYFREVADGREWAVSELLVSRASGKPVFGISRGIRDHKGALLGVVVAMIVPEKLDARLSIERGEGGGLALVDHTGMLVYRYPALEVTWEERNWLKQYPEFEEVLKGRELATAVHGPFERKSRLVGFTPVPSVGWAATAGSREEDVAWAALGSIARNAFLFLLVSLGAFFVAAAFSRKIANPISSLRAHVIALGDGKATDPVRPGDISEVQDLAEAFEAMSEKVQARETALRESEERLRQAHARMEWLARFPEENRSPVMRVSAGGEALYCNPASGELPGWQYSVGRKLADPLLSLIGQAMVDGREVQQDLVLGERYYAVAVIPVPEAGYANVYGIDITDRKNAEEAVRRSRDELEDRVKERTAELQEVNAALLSEVSERRKSQEALRIANAYNRSLIEASLDPLVTIDPEGKISDVNSATEAITGYSRSDLIGTDFSDYFTEPKKAQEGYMRVFQAGFVQDYPLAIRQRSGHVSPVLYNASVYRDDSGNVIGVFAAARDVTEIKKAYEEVQKSRDELEIRVQERTADLSAANKELESFSYTVSHDLRAPLRAIDGFAKMILDDTSAQLDEETKRRFGIIRKNTQVMGQLIDDLLSFSRLGRTEMRLSEIDMTRLAADVADDLRPRDDGRIIDMKISRLPAARGDRTLLRQVMVNLMSNAVKFTKKRQSPVIEVGGHEEGLENVYYVRDNGAGFDMKYYDKLFGVFQRLHSTTDYEGTGVGLAIVQRIIRRHNGRVWADGEIDKGACFYFTLPRKELIL
jgi:PAS domain S-box-containing protein